MFASDNTTDDTPPMIRRISLVLECVKNLGLAEQKTESISVRMNPELMRRAKELTGIEASSTIIELAVASLVLEDGFPEAFLRARGQVPDDINLEI